MMVTSKGLKQHRTRYGPNRTRYDLADKLLFCIGFALLLPFSNLQAGDVADPKKHSYADPSGHREFYHDSEAPTNEFRLYDFYQRQADHYLEIPVDQRPKLLPAYPGLDAGQHGHWGKYNQNSHKDGRWNNVEIGSIHTQVTRGPKSLPLVIKGLNVKLADGLACCFDPDSLNYRGVWKGWISFNPFRWGTSRNATIKGELQFSQSNPITIKGGKYLGLYRNGERVIFHYRVGNVEILDSPSAKNGKFVRTVEVISEGGKASLPKLPGPPVTYGNLQQYTKGGNPAWPETVTTKLTQGSSDSNYVVDTFEVPYENPFSSVMQMSGIAFGADDTMYVSTLVGEIWTVKEAGDQLIWKRYASGLNSPMGLHYDQDGLFALDRGQIYRFHDLNNDGEADYYENYANDFRDEGKSHTHTFGLHRTKDGSFFFTQKEQIMKTSPDRVTSEIGYGIRNGMGIGGSAEKFWIGPQEGNWTPASTIIEVEEGNFYGLPKPGEPNPIAAPLCFIPRGIDNSTGGFVEITSDRWGPFKGSHVGLSFGACSQYLTLRDANGPKPQGATVPLDGEFLAGVVRGTFRESDGQLYVVGLDGWGDYSQKDGCLHRVRYTGGEVRKPSGFQVFENGLQIDFPMELDPDSVKEASNYLAQTWEYIFSKGYGSPEYSAKSNKVGHDLIPVVSAHVIKGSKNSIFVEMPSFEPTMVMYLRMHLKTKTGESFKTDLFASPMYPQPHYEFDGAKPPVSGKAKQVAMRIQTDAKAAKTSNKVIEGARQVVVNAVSGLRYDKTLIEAKRGEPIALKLVNKDVMPHNLIIVAPKAKTKVGEASFKMLNNPKAASLNYAPKMKEVLKVVPVIDPDTDYTLYFRAPNKKGDYPYICTFPGHWQVMQGVLRVQ